MQEERLLERKQRKNMSSRAWTDFSGYCATDHCFSDCWADKNKSWGSSLSNPSLKSLSASPCGGSHEPTEHPGRVPEQPGSGGWDPTSRVGALPLQSWKGRNPPALLCCALPRLILGPFCVLSSLNLTTVLHKPLQKAGEGPRHSKYWKAMTVAGKQRCLGQISATAFLWRHSREIAQRTQSST